MKKLAFLMAIIIALSSFPMLFSVSTLAAEADYEASIGDTGYATLEEAIAATTTGQTITLLKDVTVDSADGITILDATPRDITIDGNGKTITSTVSTTNRATFYVQSGSLTLKNLTINTTSAGSGVWGASISKNANTTVTYDNCIVNVKGSIGKGTVSSIFAGKTVLKDTIIVSERPVFYIYEGNNNAALFETTNSTAVAASFGISATVSGLNYIENADPFSVVAVAGSTAYTSIATAIKEVANNTNTADTIELLQDTSVGGTGGIQIDAAKNFTINGNGHTISSTVSGLGIFYVRKNTMTLNDMTLDANFTVTTAWGAILTNGATAKIVTNNCDIKVRGIAGNGAIGLNGGSVIELNDTTITSASNLIYVYQNNSANGTVTAKNSTATAPSMGDTITSVEGLTFTSTSTETPPEKAVASAGGVYYTSLEEAVTAAVASSQADNGATKVTIELLKDLTIASTSGITFGKDGGNFFDITINGNGHTVTNTVTSQATIYVWMGKLTLNDMTINSTCNGGYGSVISRDATATTKTGKAEIVLNDVDINIRVGSQGLNDFFLNNAGKVTFTGKNTIASTSSKAVFNAGAGTIDFSNSETTVRAATLGLDPVPTGVTFVATTDPFNEAVASAGGVNYSSLEAAVTAVANDTNTATVIELLKDATVDGNGITIEAVKDFTINGNGHTVSGTINTQYTGIFYVKKSTVTLNNIKLDATLENANTWGPIMVNGATAKIVTNNCDIKAKGSSATSAMGLNGGGIIELNDTNITSAFKLIYLFNNDATKGTVKATNSTATAPSMGDTITSVEGLTFTSTSTETPPENAVASAGGVYYTSLEEAVNTAVASSQADNAAEVTVKLLKDTSITSDMGIVMGTENGTAFNLIIDGNGKKVSNTLTNPDYGCGTFYAKCGTTTIKNITIHTTNNTKQAFGAVVSRYAGTTVILEDVVIKVDGSLGNSATLANAAPIIFKGTNTVDSTFRAFNTMVGGTVTATGSTTTVKAPNLGLAPTPEGITYTGNVDPASAVASAGSIYYSSLEAAVTAVATNENTATVIELLKDTTVDGDGIIIDAVKNFTINGNEHTVSGTITTGARGIFYVRKNTVTLNNIKLDATLTNAGSWGAILVNNLAAGNNAKIVTNNCDIKVRGTTGTSAMGLNAGASIELNNTNIDTCFKLIHDLAENGTVTATSSTATAPTMGDIAKVEGLTFTKNNPFDPGDAAIGATIYKTLPEAFAAAESGDVIELLRDINVTTTGTPGCIICTINNADVTLEGNGKTITSVADVVLAIKHDGSSSVENGSNSSVVIKNLTLISNDSTNYGTVLQLNTDTKVTLENCTLDSVKKNSLGTALLQTGSHLVLCGGTEIAPTIKGTAIYFNGPNCSVEINDAKVSADRAFYMKQTGLKITISTGADISVNSELFAINGDAVPVVNISGGKIKSANANAPIITVKNANAKVNVFGGSFEGGNAIFENTATTEKLAYTSGTSEVLLPDMITGASVRLVPDSAGIRFTTTIPKAFIDYINSVKDEGTEISFGTIVTPAANVAQAGLFTIEALDNCSEIRGAKYQQIKATKNGMKTNEDGSITLNAALIDIKLANYQREFAATAYVTYTINGETEYVYTEYVPENNSRTIYGVACAALADVSATQDEKDYKYPVTSYLVKGEDQVYSYTTANAFSKYSEDQRKILDNYFKLVPNHDEVILETVTKTVADNTEAIFRTIGRSYVRNNGLACDFTASGIEFAAYCSGPVYVKINSSAVAYYTVYIDGVRQSKKIKVSANNTEWIEIAYVIEGDHTFTLVKQSQPSMARTEFLEVKLNGNFKNKPADKELFIEFYGDSILNGSNVLYEAGVSTNVHNSDGTQAFGWLTAEALGADASIIGRGGMAILSKTNDTDYNMMMLYELNGAYEAGNATKYDFARKPDIVVVELGINDYVKGECKGNPETFKGAVTNFVAALREKYGNDVAIVWLYGYSTDDYSTVAMEALDVIKTAGDSNIYYCQMPSDCCYTGSGDTDVYHPDQAGAKVMAETLTAFIKANILK